MCLMYRYIYICVMFFHAVSSLICFMFVSACVLYVFEACLLHHYYYIRNDKGQASGPCVLNP